MGCAANSYFVDWTVLGLETPFHVAMIIVCPLAIATALETPSRRATTLAVLAVVALGTARPESALYVIINFVAPFVAVRTRADLVRIIRGLTPIALNAGGIIRESAQPFALLIIVNS